MLSNSFRIRTYKVPSCVLGEAMLDQFPSVSAELATAQSFRDYAYPGVTLFPKQSVYGEQYQSSRAD